MKVNVLTLYPEMFPGCLGYSLVGKALAEKKWELNVVNIRDFSGKALLAKNFSDRNVAMAFDFFLSGDEFLPMIEQHFHYDCIFLDIEMPEMSGIDFMRSIDLSDTEVIIFSSQEKYALESYEYDVCDYLLKPVSYARFIKAIGKAQANLEQKRHALASESAEGDAPSGDDEEANY